MAEAHERAMEATDLADTMASVTGSRSATVRKEQRQADGSLVVLAQATSAPRQPCQWVACQAPATTTRVIGSTTWRVCSTHRTGFAVAAPAPVKASRKRASKVGAL
jgi:hypothetical protein